MCVQGGTEIIVTNKKEQETYLLKKCYTLK